MKQYKQKKSLSGDGLQFLLLPPFLIITLGCINTHDAADWDDLLTLVEVSVSAA